MVLIYVIGYRNYNPILMVIVMFPNIGLAISFDVVHVIVLSISTSPDKKGNAMERNSPQKSFWIRTRVPQIPQGVLKGGFV